MNIQVIYEDQWLLVVNKPSGLLTIPTPKHESRTLTSILNDDARSKSVQYRFHPCHRLDRDTSGLMIYAKGASVQKKMMDIFRQKKINKQYLALVRGEPALTNGIMRLAVEGKPAQTSYRVIERKKHFSVVEAMPMTGRTNQIRIHFAHLGHPILGEDKYAFRRDFKIRAKRLCLHAQAISFVHPITGEEVSLSAAIPEYFVQFFNEHDND